MKKFFFLILLGTFAVGLFALPAMAVVEQVTFDPAGSDQPDGVFDAAGNAHVVWVDDRDFVNEIYYKMVDPEGTVLIDDTRITDTISDSVRPRAAIDSLDRVFVV